MKVSIFIAVCFLAIATAFNHANKWPFEMVDKIVSEMSSSMRSAQMQAMNYQLDQRSYHLKTEKLKEMEAEAYKDVDEFDFIIIGGGTSGSVLASRLSEIPEWKILLLEAGGSETDTTQIPKNWRYLTNSPFSWGFYTTPQNYTCLAYVDQKCTIPSGKVLGGTSAINSMIYTRGNKRDYDIWADEDNHGWCYEEILEYFKKAEDAHIGYLDDKFHQYGGLQYIEHPAHLTKLAETVLEAGRELGLQTVDYNGKSQMGVGLAQLTTNCGQRYSTAQSYLKPTLKRHNLVIKPMCEVLKLKISPHTKDIKGVEYLHEDKMFVAKAKKEVLLAAGAINTPKILMLSGIGPEEEFKKLDIPHLLDLKVGHNLQTRPSFTLDFLFDYPEDNTIDENQEMLKYLRDGTGEFSAPGIEALAFLHTKESKDNAKYPDIELQFAHKIYQNYDKVTKGLINEEQYNSIYKPIEGKHGMQINVILTHPKSRGFVKLHDNDPLHYPMIEPYALHEESDVKTLLAGVKEALKFTESEPFKRIGVSLNTNPVKECDKLKFASDEYWICAIKYMTVLTEDVSGTTKMGPETDVKAVVDNHLKVRGVDHLRVVDASVIPTPISGGLTAVNIMIGEKAADMIKKDWY